MPAEQTSLPFPDPASPEPESRPDPVPAGAADREHRDAERARLTAEVEAAVVRELASTYGWLNGSLFRRKLKGAAIELTDVESLLGRYSPGTRTIEIARRIVLGDWGVVVEVLKHEMAHQYVHEVLEKHDETAHGPAFRELCVRLGIDGRAAGAPAASATPEETRVLERIARLLALAESPNENEAQAAMGAAQRLMLKHNLDHVRERGARGYAFKHLGRPTGRVTEAERVLGSILGTHFFVEVIWVPVFRPLDEQRASVLEACGTPSNLEMAAYVHAFLTHTADQLWLSHKRQHGVDGDRDRRAFLAGVMLGFLEKLNRERTRHKEDGLVWRGDGDLEDYYRRRHPHIRNVKTGGGRRGEAHAHGRSAGRQIVLHKPVSEGSSGSGSRLLPPKK